MGADDGRARDAARFINIRPCATKCMLRCDGAGRRRRSLRFANIIKLAADLGRKIFFFHTRSPGECATCECQKDRIRPLTTSQNRFLLGVPSTAQRLASDAQRASQENTQLEVPCSMPQGTPGFKPTFILIFRCALACIVESKHLAPAGRIPATPASGSTGLHPPSAGGHF